jgi:prepilin-type N-terminal cleavage/methylation domain-containing protein
MKIAHKQTGFTMLELMVAVAIFVVISGAIFGLLGLSQKQFRTESQLLGSFEEARLGMDQIVRDVSDAGYPPANHFSVTPAVTAYASTPIAWSPSYPGTPCQIGTTLAPGTCDTPGDFGFIMEGDVDGTGVKWIRYKLIGTTLYRAAINKTAGDPNGATIDKLIPYVTNVMNDASAAQIAQFQTTYPNMFPGGNVVPLFQYTCDTAAGTVLCQNAGASNSPQNVRDVEITIIVMTPQPDAQTGQVRLVELNGRARRVNPNQ